MIKKLEQLRDVRALRLTREIKILQQARDKLKRARDALTELFADQEDANQKIQKMQLITTVGVQITVGEMDAFFTRRNLLRENLKTIEERILTQQANIEELIRLLQQQQLIVNKARLKSDTIETQLKQYRVAQSRMKQRSEDSMIDDSFRTKPNSLL